MSKAIRPPVAARRPTSTTLHGDARVDDYAWLKDRNDPDTIPYLEAENAFTKASMRSTIALQKQLFREMRGRIKETDLDVPARIDDYYYYGRTRRGQQYSIFCRKHGSLRAREEIILDHNRLARGHEYFAVEAHAISRDHRLLAYTFDTKGDERLTLRVKDLRTGKLLPDTIENVSSVTWAADSRTLFYVTLDEAHRPFKLFRHTLGTPTSDDVLVHHEKDEAFFVGISSTRSRAYVVLSLRAKTSTEMRVLASDRPADRFVVIEPRQPKIEYSIEHHGEHFYILHNRGAKNFRLDRTPTRAPAAKNWRPVVPHRKDVLIEHVDAFASHLVLYERQDGLEYIRIRALDDGTDHRISFDEPTYSVGGGSNPEFHSTTLRFVYASLITPQSVFDYDMKTRKRELKKRTEVRGGYDPKRYCSERIFAKASDGARIPISIVYRKGLRRGRPAPTVLTGYGSYGLSRDASFSIPRISLLDRGVIYAIAHIRGGSEMGRSWYEDGKFLKKKNTFTDFVACAETLIRQRYTTAAKLAIQGGSAGGLLMGAVVNLRPDLFGVVVADVPFVDCLNTMLDPTLPLTITEYDEWGNPNERKYYRYMKSYSPYENVAKTAYPTMLVTAGLNDPRVGYWEPAKWVAKIRAQRTDNRELLLKTEMGSGHFGASGRYNVLKEIAFDYAFVLTRLGAE